MLNEIIASIRNQTPLGPIHCFVSTINIPQNSLQVCQFNGLQINCKFSANGLAELRNKLVEPSLFSLIGKAILIEAANFDKSSKCFVIDKLSIVNESWDFTKPLPQWHNIETDETLATVLEYCKHRQCPKSLELIPFVDLFRESLTPHKNSTPNVKVLASPVV